MYVRSPTQPLAKRLLHDLGFLMMAEIPSISLLVLLLGACCNAQTVMLDSMVTPGENFSLEYHLCDATDQLHSNTTMTLSAGTHGIRDGTACIVRDISNLTIRGTTEPGETSTILCLPSESAGFVIRGGGFFFVNITNLRIEHVVVVNCGTELPAVLPAYVNSTSAYFGPGQKVALLFSHCTGLQLENVTLSRGFGLGIVGINLMGDSELNSVTISDTDNSNHFLCIGSLDSRFDLDCSGSGAAFVYYDPPNTDSPPDNTSLTINNCAFTNNINIIPNVRLLPLYVSFRSAFRTEPVLITGASGLGVYFAQRAYHVDFKLQNSVIEGNDGYISGMLLLFYNTIRDTTVLIDGCDLIRNRARLEGRGGALVIFVEHYLDMLASFPEYPDDIYEIVSITRSRFIGNHASVGGAIYVHVTPQNISEYRVSIDNSTFASNVASVGSAIGTASIRSTFTAKSHHLLLQDIVAYDNTFPNSDVNRNSTPQNSGIFVFLLTNNVTVTGRFHTEGSKFYNNSPGVFLTTGANIFLRGHLEFSNNVGFNGGAVSLYDYSVLFFHEGLNIRFENNRALQSGGAIFANSLGTGITDICVVQIIGPSLIFNSRDAHLLNLNITFANNSAGESGNSIHANPLYACGYLPEASVQHTMLLDNEREVYDAIFQIESTVGNGLQEISSIPVGITICNQTQFLAEFNVNIPTQRVQTIPGRQFIVFVAPVDAIGLPVSSLLYAEVDIPGIKLGPAQSIRQVHGSSCSKVEFSVYGPENSFTNISLYVSPGRRESVLVVSIGPCPPGFQMDVLNGLQQCACDEYVVNKIGTTCNTTTYTIARPENSWIGTFDHGNGSRNDVIYVSTCPIDYCNESVTNVDLTIEDQLCEYGRSGILCGQCRQNLSVVFGSAECEQCSNYWLFTILGYGFAGILLVLLLFILDLTVTKGTINGLIFYVNVVSVNANIFFRGSSDGFLFVFVSLLNLELGFPMCFFNGMNEIAKVGLQFVFPSYLLLISVGIILLSRWSSRIQKLTSLSGLHVLATLIYLSYAKTLRTVIDTLSFGTVHGSVDEHLIWLFDGNVVYLTGVHIFLFILAIIVILTFLVPYTLPLLFVKLLQRYTKPRLKPLLDAYLGPYKDQWRYWFGLRLTLLLTMCILYAVIGTDIPRLVLLIQLYVVVLFTILQAFIRPFKNFAVELLDMFFMVNFIILTIGTSYIIDSEQRLESQAILVGVMVSLAFIAFCGIIGYHVFRALQRFPTIKEKLDQLFVKCKELKPTHKKFKILKHQIKGVRNLSLPGSELEKGTATMKEYPNTVDRSVMGYPSVPVTEISLSDAELPPDRDTSYQPHSFSQLREPVLEYQ